jgi:nucleotide-binding universal stress UspA family protein
MYKHILVATDGSALSRKAIATAVKLAKSVGARVTGAYVIPPYTPALVGDSLVYVPAMSPQGRRAIHKRASKKALDVVVSMARGAGVRGGVLHVSAPTPWQGIIGTARRKKCDLIVMASHGRRGLAGLVIGSETNKVLTHSKIPVLVCR